MKFRVINRTREQKELKQEEELERKRGSEVLDFLESKKKSVERKLKKKGKILDSNGKIKKMQPVIEKRSIGTFSDIWPSS